MTTPPTILTHGVEKSTLPTQPAVAPSSTKMSETPALKASELMMTARRAEGAARLVVRELARVLVERADLEHAHHLKPEGDDDQTADDAHPGRRKEHVADPAGGRAEQHEDERDSAVEGERVDDDGAPRRRAP